MDEVIDVSRKVFKLLGQGFDTRVYLDAMKVGLQLEEQMLEEGRSWPITYDGFAIGHTVEADLVVNQELVVLVRSEDDIDLDDLRRVLKFSGLTQGIIVNFGDELSYSKVKL